MNILEELKSRELIHNITDEEALNEQLKERTTLYCGFDPTSDSLHIGSLLPLITLMRFEKSGHNPIALIGGATGMIGDPSGKSEERKMLSDIEIVSNSNSISKQVSSIVGNNLIIKNNISWFNEMTIIEFMRDFGKFFSVNAMIRKDSVRSRIEREGEGISFTEFSYMLFQSVDFLSLFKEENCRLQIGGSDQWGNLTSGIDLINRISDKKSAHGLTFPLLLKSDGSKFGKSENGNVWLSSEKTSVFDFFQFWLNVSDDDVFSLMKKLTFLSLDEIDEIKRFDQESGKKPTAQNVLAKEITKIVHGEEKMNSASRISDALFKNDFGLLHEKDFIEMEKFLLPSIHNQSEHIVDILINTRLAKSKRESREFINNSAVSINGTKIDSNFNFFSEDLLFFNKWAIIKRGKRNTKLIKISKEN